MFAARCIAVVSSVFFLVHVILSLAVSCGWRRIVTSRYIQNLSPGIGQICCSHCGYYRSQLRLRSQPLSFCHCLFFWNRVPSTNP